MDELIREFKEKGIHRGRTYYFLANDAIAIIQKCRILNKIMYGIEAFIITDKTTQVVAYMDYTSKYYENFNESEYFSMLHAKKNSDAGHWVEAEQFVKDRQKNGWYFDISYEKQ